MAVIVDGSRERSRIVELESLNNQMRWWRWGATLFMVVFLTLCIWQLNHSVRGLTNPGPDQDQFVQSLNTSLQTDTIPNLESEATATLTEVQPEIRVAVLKLKDKVPDLAQAAEDQVRLLQKDLPAKGEEILNKKFATILTSREDTIKKLYPNVTPDQLNALVTNLSQHARTQITEANSDLFGPHQAKLQSILASMDTIRSQEAVTVKNDQPDWEMGVLLLDVFRDDLDTLIKPAKAASDSKKVVSNDDSTHKGGI
jgi:hypothetical protein